VLPVPTRVGRQKKERQHGRVRATTK
jgi:hypothetical protein